MLNRRQFGITATAAAFAGLASQSKAIAAGAMRQARGYGPFVADPSGLIDLPEGFSYRILSSFGDAMTDGLNVPNFADGMGCFALDNGKIALVRNHELQPKHMDFSAYAAKPHLPRESFDAIDGKALPGGTTTIVLDPERLAVEQQYLSLVGTIRNCSGGITPWGSWLTCEEAVHGPEQGVGQEHGWVFEVPANAGGLVEAKPLKSMGRFMREAVCIDPSTGIVYMTEDRADSLFYRFLPEVVGDLAKGGRLQALALVDGVRDSRNWEQPSLPLQEWKLTRWIDLDDVESPKDDLRTRGAAAGGVIFARGEGVHWGDRELYFTCTSGGARQEGQIMRYRPSPYEGQGPARDAGGHLQLFLETTDPRQYSFGDNLTVAPNGHLMVCEDQYHDVVDNHLRGITPSGEVYTFARIVVQAEPAGVCFAPDGKTMFVNLYSPAKTLAIRGPF
jgi:secreted PhoX family phosphatase